MQETLFSIIEHGSYFALFGVLLAAGLGLPLPEDIPLVAAGWLVHRGKADLTLMIITGMLGVMVGDSLIFNMGRKYGTNLVGHRWLQRIAKPTLVAKAERMFANHGAKIVFAGRFMPGIRAVIFLIAGVCKVPYWKFALIDGTAAVISVPVWIIAGKVFGGKIEQVFGVGRDATLIAVGVLVLLLAAWGAWEYFRHYRKSKQAGGPAKLDHLPIDLPAEEPVKSASAKTIVADHGLPPPVAKPGPAVKSTGTA